MIKKIHRRRQSFLRRRNYRKKDDMSCIGVKQNLACRGDVDAKAVEGRDQEQRGEDRELDGAGNIEGNHQECNGDGQI